MKRNHLQFVAKFRAFAILISIASVSPAQYDPYLDSRVRNEHRLLEFVSPHYKGSMLHDVIVRGMSEQFNVNSEQMKKNKENIAKLYVSALRTEDQNRRLDATARIHWAQQLGMRSNSLTQTRGANEKAMSIDAKDDLKLKKLESAELQFEIQKRERKLNLDKKYDTIKSKLPTAVSSKTGKYLNTLFESLQPDLLRFGYTLDFDREFKKYIDELTLEPGDFKKIQLTLNADGNPITFAASEGSGSLGRIPFAMQEPDIKEIVKEIESIFAALAKMSNNDDRFRPLVKAIPEKLDNLEETSLKILGTRRDAWMTGGPSGTEKWDNANDFRRGLRWILNRLETEGTPEILQSRAKYDPAVHGNKLLPFLTFMASNSCRFGAAKPGDEDAYVKMHELLLKFHAIIEE